MYKFENVKKFCRSSLVLDEQISSTFKPDNSLAGLLFRIFYSNQKVILVQNILSTKGWEGFAVQNKMHCFKINTVYYLLFNPAVKIAIFN